MAWWGRRGLNPQGVTAAEVMARCVCQFRHVPVWCGGPAAASSANRPPSLPGLGAPARPCEDLAGALGHVINHPPPLCDVICNVPCARPPVRPTVRLVRHTAGTSEPP